MPWSSPLTRLFVGVRAAAMLVVLSAAAAAQAALPSRTMAAAVRGDTLIQRTGGEQSVEIRYLITKDSVLVISVMGRPVRRVLQSPDAELMRAEASRVKSGGVMDSAAAVAAMRAMRTGYSTMPKGFAAVRPLPNGDTIYLRGDTIRIVRAERAAAAPIVLTLTSAGATLLSPGGPRRLPESVADMIAVLRMSESVSINIDRLLGEIGRGR
jgi:hypothetical protein